ncbi:MAG TPA: phosphate-starvation-inducible PsiE family protein [candidate division Zixibacteria bacterium]|nr:phosphate-starvation-inducible PsiE family protein [candidate division Zixibacteria bacterium]
MSVIIKTRQRATRFFAVCEDVIYGLIGILLVAVGLVVVYEAGASFMEAMTGGSTALGIIRVIDNILLGLMVAEILYTVVVSFESHALQAEPFLIVGLIATVRRLLLISLEAAHISQIGHEVFVDYMIEMGVLTVLVLFFGFSIYLLRRQRNREAANTTP